MQTQKNLPETVDDQASFWYHYFTMNLDLIFKVAEVVLAVLLILSILLQSRGTGIGAAFGGGGNVYRTKRGAEKKLFQATILIAILFFGVSIAGILL